MSDKDKVWPTGLTEAESEEIHRHLIQGTQIFGMIAALAQVKGEPHDLRKNVVRREALRGHPDLPLRCRNRLVLRASRDHDEHDLGEGFPERQGEACRDGSCQVVGP